MVLYKIRLEYQGKNIKAGKVSKPIDSPTGINKMLQLT